MKPKVSFIVVARNSAKFLDNLFSDLLGQDFSFERMEFLLVDGESEDGTLERMKDFKEKNRALKIEVLPNPGRTLSAGWNVALAASSGDILLRVDAHSRLEGDFVRRNVERIEAGEAICGGYLKCVASSEWWGGMLHACENSRFGGGAADFRNQGEPRVVDTVAYAAYRKEVFVKVGGYDERLVRNQDNEIHHRMKNAGYRFFYDPAIRSHYLMRSSLKGLLTQKLWNGYWVGLMLGVAPVCLRFRHLAPAGFFGLILMALSMILMNDLRPWIRVPVFSLAGLYLLLNFYFTARSVNRSISRFLILPWMFFLIHASYGIGSFLGLAKMPWFIFRNRGYRVPRPISNVV